VQVALARLGTAAALSASLPFGQMKADMHYKRFRHFGKDKVYMDIGLFGIGFNLKKYLGIKR
jgi:hypothetical protein